MRSEGEPGFNPSRVPFVPADQAAAVATAHYVSEVHLGYGPTPHS